jgi:hypothetical protein
MLKNQKGVGHILLILVGVVVLVGVGVVVYGAATGKFGDKNKNRNQGNTTSAMWSFNGQVWQASGTPPACPNPLTITSPVDVAKVTEILYPGQYRGGNYKPHGGFRFGNSHNNEITVKIPMDAQLVKGSRYIEQGETQYLMMFIADCGIMYRFDHLHDLSPQFQAYMGKLPPAQVDNSQTTPFEPPISVKTGEVVATGVGFAATGNVTMDFGVYDLRSQNMMSKNSQWMGMHGDDHEFAFYGVCWLDMMGNNSAQLKGLSAGDGTSGNISDYCATSAGNTLTNTVGNTMNQQMH